MPDAPDNGEPPQIDYKAPTGMALLGLGVPTAVAGGFLFRMVFLPGRGGSHALVLFSPDHPYAKVSGALLLVGLLLIVAGLWLTRRPDRRSDASVSRRLPPLNLTVDASLPASASQGRRVPRRRGAAASGGP